MKSMNSVEAKGHFTTEDVLSILNACAQAKVRKISLPGLCLEFDEPRYETQGPLNPSTALPKPAEATLSAQHKPNQEEETLLVDELHVKEERLALMRIENPLEAERLLFSGELEETGSGSIEEELDH